MVENATDRKNGISGSEHSLFRRFERHIVQPNIYVAICGGFAATLPFLVFNRPYSAAFPLFVAIGIWFIYTWQKAQASPNGLRMVKPWQPILFGALLFFCFFWNLSVNLWGILVLALAALLSVLYVKPYIPKGENRYSLRALPHAKIWTVLAVWVLVVVVLPLASMIFTGGVDDALAISAFIAGQASFILALIIPFDIRDLAVDEPSQHTIPMLLGIEKSVRLALACLGFSVLTVLVQYSLGFGNLSLAAAQLLAIGLTFLVVRRANVHHKDHYYTVAVDGCLMLQPLLICLFNLF